MDVMKVVSKFNFYQQIRTILKKLVTKDISQNELLNHHIELISSLSLSAPNGEIERIEKRDEHYDLTVTVLKYGLTGALSTLPTVYNEWLIERQSRYSDRGAKSFLDIFSHRLFCLEYLAWQKNHLYAQAESGDELPLQWATLAFSGLLNTQEGTAYQPYAQLFNAPVRSLLNLEIWLSHLYQVPVVIKPFTGKWREIMASERCQLGVKTLMLGEAPMTGYAQWDIQSNFDVILGPMKQNVASHFLNDQDLMRACRHHIDSYIGNSLIFSIILRVINEYNVASYLGEGQLGRDIHLGDNLHSTTRDIIINNG